MEVELWARLSVCFWAYKTHAKLETQMEASQYRKRLPLEMCQLQAPAQLLLFSLTLFARPSSIRVSSASPTPKVDELPEGGIKGRGCWGIFSTSQYMVHTLDISQNWCQQQARTKPDCALTSLAFRFCAAFMCALLALKA